MLFKELEDKYFKNEGFSSIRRTVRGLVKDADGNFVMLKIEGEDFFGIRNHYETPGGGVEVGEGYEKALLREMEEELGVLCEIESFLGMVVGHYNLLNRINVERYYVCRIVGETSSNQTDVEKVLIKGIEHKPLNEWLEILKTGDSSVDKLVHDRDYQAFKYYADQCNM
ncbi:hypothetical protein AOC36_05515 [Erysipelothrix larvae]|uniref:Nudix hydrolase domain-containing protein n=1 Tax=Erysipelothrix larvae TaxID=1514105 RepID=A0A0X8GZY4_9FIRM|nr:NUDIX hydrolase [Erysipelothrix larvae]AMC93454.1 hypothetical protein AOC36_05515 [Erysipelothrix larvae]